MSAANFKTVNANRVYVIDNTYTTEDENGNEVVVERDSYDWDLVKKDIANYAEYAYGYEAMYGWDSDRSYPASLVCEKDDWETFGSKKPWFLEVGITKTIMLRSGYYAAANLDYDINMSDAEGNVAFLSDEGFDGMIEVMLKNIQYLVERSGREDGWTLGTFKMQQKNIKKWLENRLTEAINECEEICKNCAEEKYLCVGRFSNGEAIYEKI